MNREIKFKFWLGLNKKMTYSHKLQDFGNIIKECSPDIIPLQFTGLKDRNGKDIYEGDIIKVPDDWDEYGFMAGEIRQVYFLNGGFRLKPKSGGTAGHWLEYTNDFEVIGNIYENPDLIK